MGILMYVILLLCVLVSVAFYTLLERSVLGYVQVRKGPNKVGMMGLFQPFADAVKLFSKEQGFLLAGNLVVFFGAVVMSLLLMLMFWVVYCWEWGGMDVNFSLVVVLCISSLGVYVILCGGWASNSKYSLLGAYRGVAQTISYEVSMALLMISVMMAVNSCLLEDLLFFQDGWMLLGLIVLFYMWFVSLLAETNRSPFDFAEGESELVSGFNVEYGGGGFAILFMAEYGNIIFMSFLTCFMFLGGGVLLEWSAMIIMVFYLWVRGTYVRFRYDNLMMLVWKEFLPYSLFFLCGISGVMLWMVN